MYILSAPRPPESLDNYTAPLQAVLCVSMEKHRPMTDDKKLALPVAEQKVSQTFWTWYSYSKYTTNINKHWLMS